MSCLSSVAWIAASPVAAAAAFAFGMLLLPDFFVACYVTENFMKFSASVLPVVGYFHIKNMYSRRLLLIPCLVVFAWLLQGFRMSFVPGCIFACSVTC